MQSIQILCAFVYQERQLLQIRTIPADMHDGLILASLHVRRIYMTDLYENHFMRSRYMRRPYTSIIISGTDTRHSTFERKIACPANSESPSYLSAII